MKTDELIGIYKVPNMPYKLFSSSKNLIESNIYNIYNIYIIYIIYIAIYIILTLNKT